MAYTLIVGTKNWSSWSLRPYVALRHIGVAFKEEVIPLRRATSSADVQKRSRSGRVPVLEIDEGGSHYVVWDSLAICETLADRHPEAKLLPDDPKARALVRSYAAEMHSGFPDLRDQLPMEFARELPTPALRDATESQIARIISAWSDALAEYAGKGGFLFGSFSLADCMYAPVVSRFRTYGVALPPALQAYCDRVWALPAMKDWGKASKAEVDAGLE
ncbi:MAG TPA: glutathione S-transferase family protein [Rhizomicrobium sp.]|nr:glutathione S-transferase family protein [Rhizomicrobium sp.]